MMAAIGAICLCVGEALAKVSFVKMYYSIVPAPEVLWSIKNGTNENWLL
jgi:hypothetical protein